jgi:hypothetical protein
MEPSMKQSPYIIVQSNSCYDLEKQINEKIAEGYTLSGGIVVTNGNMCLIQAMVLPFKIN